MLVEAVYARVIDLTVLVPSITTANVWDLAVWAWWQYADYVDRERAEARKQRNS